MKVQISKQERGIKTLQDLIKVLSYYDQQFGDKNLRANIDDFGLTSNEWNVNFTWTGEVE